MRKNDLVILVREDNENRYGQDYRMNLIAEKLKIKMVSVKEKNRKIIGNFKTLITFNSDDEKTFNMINNFTDKKIICHFQLNPEFLDDEMLKRSLTILRMSNAIITPAEFLKNKLSKLLPNKNIYIVNNGVEKNIFKINKSDNNNHVLLGYVGRLSNQKGLQILNQIWDNLNSQYSLKIDSINYKTHSIRKVNVSLSHNSINRSNHPTPYFDCLIFPSLSEVAPMVVIEALMSGVPVISTNSTPYLQSLQKYFGRKYLKLIKLPVYVTKMTSKNLLLHKKDVKRISNEFLIHISKFKKLKEHEKNILRNKALKLGFDSETMIKSIEKVYVRICNDSTLEFPF